MRPWIAVLSGLIAISAGSGRATAEEKFDYAATGPHKIAILPVDYDTPLNVDSVYLRAIPDLSLEADVIDPVTIRLRMDSLGAQPVVALLLDLDPKKAKGSKLKSYANHLDSSQMTLMRDLCLGTDLVLAPADFSMKKQAGAVVAKVTHRLYDLASGNLLYDKKESVNLMPDGTMRGGGLMSVIGGGGKVKEKDLPAVIPATVNIVYGGLRNLRDKVIFAN